MPAKTEGAGVQRASSHIPSLRVPGCDLWSTEGVVVQDFSRLTES